MVANCQSKLDVAGTKVCKEGCPQTKMKPETILSKIYTKREIQPNIRTKEADNTIPILQKKPQKKGEQN